MEGGIVNSENNAQESIKWSMMRESRYPRKQSKQTMKKKASRKSSSHTYIHLIWASKVNKDKKKEKRAKKKKENTVKIEPGDGSENVIISTGWKGWITRAFSRWEWRSGDQNENGTVVDHLFVFDCSSISCNWVGLLAALR